MDLFLIKKIFDKISEIAPVVEKYCLIIKLKEEKFFVNILDAIIYENIDKVIRNTIKMYLQKNSYNLDYDAVIPPKKLLIIYKKPSLRFLLKFDDEKKFDIILNFGDYRIISMILLNSRKKYKVVGGDEISCNDFNDLNTKFKLESTSFLSTSILKKCD